MAPDPSRRPQGRRANYAKLARRGESEFVVCGGCTFTIAEVYEDYDGRGCLFQRGFRPHDDGVWQLSRRATSQLKKRGSARDRRHAFPPHLMGREVITTYMPLHFPVSARCPNCRRVNVLDGVRLDLADRELDPKSAIIQHSPAGDYLASHKVIYDPWLKKE